MKKEDLELFGMVNTYDQIVPLSKTIGFSADGSKIAIVLTRERNTPEIALSTPDGMLFLNVKTVADLKVFEQFISGYESNY